MEIFVSLSRAVQMSASSLSKIVGLRVLDHRLLREQPGFAFYAFVAFAQDDSGDYDLKIAKLLRKGLATDSYKLSEITVAGTGYQSIYEAASAMDRMDTNGKFKSLSGPPPRQSAVFQLYDFRIPFTSGLQSVIDTWARVQDIAPLRYAVVNPVTHEIEVAFEDASAYNSDIIQDMLRDSLYNALGDYSAGKNFDIPGRNLV